MSDDKIVAALSAGLISVEDARRLMGIPDTPWWEEPIA